MERSSEQQPTQAVPGVLVRVSERGVLVRGKAGTGKSLTALHLLDRGHILIADDVVRVQVSERGRLSGAPLNEDTVMEVRGLGIYPVEKLFPGQTATRCPIDLVVDLRPFDAARDVGRIKPVSETATLSGLSVPCVRLPVISCADAALMIELLVKDILLRGDRDL